MPTIRWKRQTKVQNKALGLSGPDAVYANAGEELKVDARALAAITELYGSGAFDVLEEPKAEAKAKRGKGDG